jgi:hypothetical protein
VVRKRKQVAALPMRRGQDGERKVLLVTTRSKKRDGSFPAAAPRACPIRTSQRARPAKTAM